MANNNETTIDNPFSAADNSKKKEKAPQQPNYAELVKVDNVQPDYAELVKVDKGVGGHLKDIGTSLAAGIASIPDMAIGIGDMYSGGRAGKAIEDSGIYTPGSGSDYWRDQKTINAKAQDQQRQAADGIIDKAKVVLSNPTQITNAIGESLAPMVAGGLVGRGINIASKGKIGGAAAGAIGEGVVMGGSQAESIRQQTDDGLLTGGQVGAAMATGVAGSAFGYLGGRIAQELGFADIDSVMVNGVRSDTVQDAVQEAAKKIPITSIPKKILQGAISEGILEELPQSLSEQALQNLALGKPWHENLDDAAVMGTLAGMAMGGGINAYTSSKEYLGQERKDEPQESTNPDLPMLPGGNAALEGEFIPGDRGQATTDAQGRTTYEHDQFSTDADNLLGQGAGFNPMQGNSPENPDSPIAPTTPPLSRQLGINPEDGPMSTAAALAVDSGATETMLNTPAVTDTTQDDVNNNAPLSSAAGLLNEPNDNSASNNLERPGDSALLSNTIGNDGKDTSGRNDSVNSVSGIGEPSQAAPGQPDRNNLNTVGNNSVLSGENEAAATSSSTIGTTAGDSQSRTVEPILGADGKNKWFGNQDEANAFLEKKNLGNDYQVVQDSKRFEIQPKVQAPAQDKAAPVQAPVQAKISDLEQQLATEKSVPKKAQIRKQIAELQNGLADQAQSEVSLDQPLKATAENLSGEFKRMEQATVRVNAVRQRMREANPEIFTAENDRIRETHGLTNARVTMMADEIETSGSYELSDREYEKVKNNPNYKIDYDARNFMGKVTAVKDPHSGEWVGNNEQTDLDDAAVPVQDDAHFQSKLDQLDKQRAQFEAAGDYDNAEKLYNEMQVVSREWQISGTKTTETKQKSEYVKTESDKAWSDFYKTNRNMMGDDLFEGGHKDKSALGNSPKEIQTRSAHGMAKSSPASAVADLEKLLTNGIDPNRGEGRLYTAPLNNVVENDEDRRGASMSGTSSGSSYADGAFTLVAKEGIGDIYSINDVDAVMVNSSVPKAVVDSLRKDFPEMKIGYANELQGLLSGSKQSNNSQSKVADIESQHPVNKWQEEMNKALEKADPEHPQFKKLQAGAKHGLKSVSDRAVALRQAREIEKKSEAPKAEQPKASTNTIFTEDAAEKARALLRKKLGQLNAGIDPEILQAGLTLAGYHIEKGARSFAAYAKAMTEDMGDMVKPYLKSWYMGVKFDPRASGFDGMSSSAEVENFDVDGTLTNEGTMTGKTETVVTPAGREFEVRHKVVEASDLITSNLDSGAINAEYPQALQPRDRTTLKSVTQVNDIANKLNPKLLGDSASSTNGAPIVSPGNEVESGNGRTLAIRKAYQIGKADAYKAWLAEQGYDVANMQQPILVRERITPMNMAERVAYTTESNERDTLDLSPSEQAMSDAPKVMDILHLVQGGSFNNTANRDFVNAFLTGVASKNERGTMLDKDGVSLTQDGYRRIESALLAAAFNDAQIITQVIESKDSDIKAIGNALIEAAPQWAQVRKGVQEGILVEGVNVEANLVEAVHLVRKARQQNLSLSEMLNQDDIFDGSIDQVTKNFISIFYSGDKLNKARSSQKVADALKSYAQLAMTAKASPNLFGDAPLSNEQILGQVNDRLKQSEAEKQQDIFSSQGANDTNPGKSSQVGQGSKTSEPDARTPQSNTAVKRAPVNRTKNDTTLVQDWGVQYVDGHAKNDQYPGKIETDYGVKDGVKAAFLKDSKQYLEAVQKNLESIGYELHNNKKGKPEKVSINESGVAGSGEASLYIREPITGTNVYMSIGDGRPGSHPQRIGILYRATMKENDKQASGFGIENSGNAYAGAQTSAFEMAQMIDDMVTALVKRNQDKGNGNEQSTSNSSDPKGTPAVRSGGSTTQQGNSQTNPSNVETGVPTGNATTGTAQDSERPSIRGTGKNVANNGAAGTVGNESNGRKGTSGAATLPIEQPTKLESNAALTSTAQDFHMTKTEEVKQPKADDTPAQDEPLYSRKSGNQKTGKTVDQVRDALIKRFGKDVIESLEKQGKLRIQQSYAVDGAEGFYQNGRVTLIADNLNDDSIVPTFLHELGGHGGFQNMMSKDKYAELMRQFDDLVKRGHPIALAAKRLAERENNSETQQLEYLPYLLTLASTMQQKNVLQRNALQKLIRNVISHVKAWLFDKFGINLNLNPDDMVALAERMIDQAASNAIGSNADSGIRFSRDDAPQSEVDAIRKQYENTAKWMKAPNGKPTNLTNRQWLQVRTPSFKKWFGDWEVDAANASKVVDDNGEPQVRNHGTRDNWTQWDKERAGGLIHTTDDMNIADRYAQGAGGGRKRSEPVYQDNDGNIYELDGNDYVNRQDGSRLSSRDIQDMIDYGDINPVYPDAHIKPIYVRAENPLDLNTDRGLKVLAGIQASSRFGQGVVNQAKDGYFDWNSTKHEFKNKHWANDLVPKLKALGYDAITFADDGHQTLSVFDSEKIKSATNNTGAFSSESADIRFSRQSSSDVINNLSESIKNLSAKSVKDKAGYKWTDWLGVGLQALGRRQLTEIYSKLLPQLNKYNELAAQMDADKNDAGAKADNIVREWANLKDDEALADVMHDSTLAKIDPTKPYVSGDSISKYKQLRDAYNSLSPEAQAMYLKARDAYKKHYAEVHQAIKERILRSELSNQKKADLLKQMDDNFFGSIKGVYFPLARFGKFVVVMRNQNGDVESVSRAETMGEAQALRSELIQKFPHYKVNKVKLDKEYNKSRDAVGRGFMTSLFAEVDNLGLSTAERTEFEDTLSQLYLSSMPDLSWAKHGIHRKGTAGFSQDARRAFAQNMFSGANYLAKLRYGDQLAQQLDEMQKYADEQFEVDEDYDQRSAQSVITEMNKRHDNLMNPKGHPLSSALTSMGFIYYLGLSPAAAMVNLAQTALVAYPLMGAKWDFDKAGKELLKASNDFREGVEFHKVKWQGTKTDLYKAVSSDISKFLNKDEQAAYQKAVDSGVIDVTQAHDLAGIAQGEDSGVMWKTRPIMRAASVMFHSAERFNREVTFIASYRLARQAGANHDDAYKQADNMTYKSHNDYSSGNRPRIMQGNVAKVLLLFKQFGQNMIYTLARQTYQSIKGETEAERREARRALGAILVMHATFAGALGLPMVGMLLSVASWMGGDDDEPWNAEVALRNYLAEAFNPTISNMLMKGAPRGIGVDISSRVGINNLLLPDIQEGLEGKKWWDSAASAALGPIGGIGANVAKGAQEISEGHNLRGVESMLPVFLKNFAKTYRYADEGVQDKTGVSIMDEVSSMDLLVQGMGFSPSDVRLATEGRSSVYDLQKKLDSRRSSLMTKFARAKLDDDQETMDEAWQEIQAFNEANPSRRINKVQAMQSYKKRKKRIDNAEHGMVVTRKKREDLDEGRFAYQD